MLEDLKEDVELINLLLRKSGLNFESKQVDTELEFSEAISNYSPDVILSDHTLPQFNSIEALRLCKQVGLSVPFILVTGAVSEEFAVTCIKEGADDYILKANLSRLPASINSLLKQYEQVNREKLAEENLRVQNEELIRSNKDLDSFVYTISQNLHTPLRSFQSMLKHALTEDMNGDEAHSKYLRLMNRSVLKLDETLKEIISFYRNARTGVMYQLIDASKLIDDSFERLKNLSGFAEINKTIHVEEKCPFYSDIFRLSTVLTNLISNSIVYRDIKKECVISVDLKIKKQLTLLTVEDNGIGID